MDTCHIIIASLLIFGNHMYHVDGQAVSQRFNISFTAGEFLGLFEGQKIPLTVSINAIDPDIITGHLQLQSSDDSIFRVNNLTSVDIASLGAIGLPANFTTVIEGIFLGISDFEVYFAAGDSSEGELVETYIVKVKNVDTILNPLFSYMVLGWLILSYFMMGSKMSLKDIWKRIKKPWVVLLAMACQFFLMPALAFALAKAFRLDDTAALGLIMVGTCPGGWLSNIFSLLLDLDFILSLTMTFCSTILAMGMLPFNLWLYARPLTTGAEDLQTPFFDLFLQLLYLVIPVVISMAIAHYSSKFRKYCEKLLKPVATVCILLALGLGIPAELHIYQSANVTEWIVSALLPLLGCIAGLIIAKVCCLERKKAITVSLETGAQNSLLAITMLSLFYPAPESDLIGKIPLIQGLLALVEGVTVTLIYLLARYVFCKDRYAKKDDEGDDEMVKGKEIAMDGSDLSKPPGDDFEMTLDGKQEQGAPDCDVGMSFSSIGVQVDMIGDEHGSGVDNPSYSA